jgi:hypothetical protein
MNSRRLSIAMGRQSTGGEGRATTDRLRCYLLAPRLLRFSRRSRRFRRTWRAFTRRSRGSGGHCGSTGSEHPSAIRSKQRLPVPVLNGCRAERGSHRPGEGLAAVASALHGWPFRCAAAPPPAGEGLAAVASALSELCTTYRTRAESRSVHLPTNHPSRRSNPDGIPAPSQGPRTAPETEPTPRVLRLSALSA